ncbi:class I SAM-dependent methyltransferase [Ferrimonas marina]|uniref:Methyltransferase domain-containing protein n=1 Tax=Ferrimonas marina TaxID=299255 RepID=A0A1M5ZQ05_9GAMM|nr:class I SAM-dependent methyltransferase [Ferrimonas marina]SHI26292.1 Methyltransferase domain-containing protein [Ferrimonas marina]
MSELYGKHARAYAEAIKDNDYNAEFERPTTLAMLDQALPDLRGKRVLDLGCGPGEYVAELLKRGAHVTAVDRSAEMVALVGKRFGPCPDLHCYAQDLSQGLPGEADEQYDLVLCPLMVHYLADQHPFFAECARVLKSQGQLLFSTHNPVADAALSPTGNYYAREALTDTWHTVGAPVEVVFYRRSLSEQISAVTDNGLVITQLQEGTASERLRQRNPEVYQRLTTQPNFLFVLAQRLG